MFSAVTGVVAGVIGAVLLVMQGIPPERLQAELNNMTWIHATAIVLGCCGTMLGGYVAAWMGKAFPLRHGFAVGIASLLTGLVPITLFPEMQPMWVSVAAVALVLPAGLLGGVLRASRDQRRTNSSSS